MPQPKTDQCPSCEGQGYFKYMQAKVRFHPGVKRIVHKSCDMCNGKGRVRRIEGEPNVASCVEAAAS